MGDIIKKPFLFLFVCLLLCLLSVSEAFIVRNDASWHPVRSTNHRLNHGSIVVQSQLNENNSNSNDVESNDIQSKKTIPGSKPNRGDRDLGGYDPSERIGEGIDVGDPQIKVKEKERSVTAILKELAAIQQQGPRKYCILGTRHCSYLHQQIIELL